MMRLLASYPPHSSTPIGLEAASIQDTDLASKQLPDVLFAVRFALMSELFIIAATNYRYIPVLDMARYSYRLESLACPAYERAHVTTHRI